MIVRRSKIMKRDVALRIDGLLIGIRESLGYVATYMKANVSAEEYPDIVPEELKSDPKPK